MISAAVLAGEGWTGETIAVGGATVGNRVGVSKDSGFVGTGVAVLAGRSVFVGDGIGVSDGSRVSVGGGRDVSVGSCVSVATGFSVSVGSRVPVGSDVIVSNDPGVFVSVDVQAAPGTSCWGLLVGCSAGTGGGTIKTPTFSMATPAFLKVILTNLALTGVNSVLIVSALRTIPLKPSCSELKTWAYSV